jgi:acetyl esterase/lipase
MDMDLDGEVQYDFFPFIRQYKSGRVVRFGATDTVPAGTDDTAAGTGVTSKDVVINPSSGLWARLYLPSALPSAGRQDKLPLVVYYHGGAFVIGSTANRPTHEYLNRLAADANVLIVSPEYRLAPEHPLPTAHDDSWEALRWVASHATTTWEGPAEPWLVEHGDLTRVFLAGVSAGGNIAHNMAERAGAQSLGVPVRGLLLVHPYFTGGEATDTARKARSEAMWRYVCPGTTGLDDPLGNPFSEAAGGSAARIAAERVLVCVAEKDSLRGRGVWYYESLRGSGYRGEVEELHESVGEGHVFHYGNPGCDEARVLQARVLRFLRTR